MNKQVIFLQEWFKKRTERERLYLFLGGFVIIYLFYFIFFHHAVTKQKNDLQQKIVAVQAQQVIVQQQMNQITELLKNPIFLQMIAEQKRLTAQLDSLLQQIDALRPSLSADDLPQLTKKILSQQRNNVILISLQELPVEPWPSQNLIDKNSLLSPFTGLYQHILQIEFQNDYFSTIDYLQRLEKLSSHIYWDSMNYKVLAYPKADVVIQFHVLSLQKS